MCGLVMPISLIDGCTAEHWIEVKSIIADAVASIPDPRFSVRLVSTADDIGVIQKRIVQNLYNDAIIVCDVSAKNPNVMFELGMRLAFDKPTVIVKDDKTTYSFDTSPIEHVGYPRDLRFTKIVQFKEELAKKIVATYQASKTDPKHSTFLKHFGTFQVAKLSQETVSLDKAILGQLSDIQAQILSLTRQNNLLRLRLVAPERTSQVNNIDSAIMEALAKQRAEPLSDLWKLQWVSDDKDKGNE